MAYTITVPQVMKTQLEHLAMANALHVRTGGGAGELFKTPDATIAELLPLSGTMFQLVSVEIQAERGKLSNRTNQAGEKYSVATGKTEVICKVTATHPATNKSFTFRAKLGEIAAADSEGKIVLFMEMVGTKTDTTGAVTEPGQFWIHAEQGATIDQQLAVIEAANVPTVANVGP